MTFPTNEQEKQMLSDRELYELDADICPLCNLLIGDCKCDADEVEEFLDEL